MTKKKSVLTLLMGLFLLSSSFAFAACKEDAADDETDTLALERRIEYVLNNYEDNDDGLYTEESFKALTDALAEAQAVLQDENSTQEEIDAAEKKLTEAMDALVTQFQPNYTIDEIAVMIAEIGSNYTLEVTDYYSEGATQEKPLSYKVYYTSDGTRYNENINYGVTPYDGYVHSFSFDKETGDVAMGRVYMKQDASPIVYLFDDELWRVNTSLADLEEYEFWANGPADFRNVAGTNLYTCSNDVYYERLSDPILSGYLWEGELDQAIGGVSLEVLEGDVIEFSFYGETQEDKIFSYKVTNIEKTELDAVADYKTENPEYKTSYNPKGILSDLDTNYLIDSGYRLQFDVFTSSAGLAGETPDYSVTGVYEEYGDYKYWYSSRENGVIPMSDGLYSVEVKDGKASLGDAVEDYTIEDYNFYTYLIGLYSDFVNLEGTEEYYIDLNENSEVKGFMSRVFGVSGNIKSVSISKSDEGKLVVSLWSDYSDATHQNREGLMLRAVLNNSSSAKTEEIESFIDSLSSLEALNDKLAEAEEYAKENYTESSLAVLQEAISQAKAVVADEGRTAEEVEAARTALENAISGLKTPADSQTNGELKAAVTRGKLYTAANYTKDSYAALDSAIKEAEELLKSEFTTEDGTAAVTAIEKAIRGLVELADKTALEEAIAEAKKISTEGMTKESTTALETALAAAESGVENQELTAGEAKTILETLEKAIEGLEPLAENKNELTELYEQIKDIKNDDGKYTASSYKAFDAVRSYTAEALKDEQLSEADCAELLILLQGRYEELETAESSSGYIKFSDITKFIDSNKISGASNFTLKVTENGVTREYVFSDKYFYDEANKSGYIWFEGFPHTFTIGENGFVLGDMVMKNGGTIPYITQLLDSIGDSYLLTEDWAARIGNTNEWFSTDVNFALFIPEYQELISDFGFGMALEGNVLTFTVWGKSSLSIPAFDGATEGEKVSLLRTEKLWSATIEKVGESSAAEVEKWLESVSKGRVSAEDITDIFAGMGDNYTSTAFGDESSFIRTEKYYFDGESGYILIDGVVKEIWLVEGSIEIGGIVYIDGAPATTLEQLVPSLAFLKELTAEELTLAETKDSTSYYKLSEENEQKLALALGVKGELYLSVNGSGELCILVDGVNAYQKPDYIVISHVGSTQNADIEKLLSV